MKKLAMLCVVIAACGGDTQADDAVPEAAQQAAQAAGAPSAAQVQAGLAAGSIDTGGRVSATIGGALSGSTDMTDVTFCVKEAAGMTVFAMAANNQQWSVSLASIKGQPQVQSYPVTNGATEGMTVGLIDKSTGAGPSEWQQYNGVSGTVEITRSDAQRVTGSYNFTASPSYPRTTGDNVTVQGTFDAPPATRC